ncbi:hypothetical protein [Cytobacillus praedii]|uniref:hypothetical protein n=1 Tax=Cytobacillus praedii TaxID=1742358 RepID=UPI002E1EF2CB|nr:hypothetical protein [Cytobacillus praedii]
MNELLIEYRQTLKETRSLLASLEKKIKAVKITGNKEELVKLEEDKSIVNSWISNLQYSIQWLSTGRRPGSTRGIERRSVYQKEILIDGMEIAKVIDSGQSYYPEEESIESEEEQLYFEKVTNSILDVLTEKERDIYNMHLNGLAPFEISNYMDIPYKTVYKSINRCQEKIRNEDVSFL